MKRETSEMWTKPADLQDTEADRFQTGCGPHRFSLDLEVRNLLWKTEICCISMGALF